MSTLYPNQNFGFIELAKRTKDQGMIEISEVLNTNHGEFLAAMPMFDANQGMSEKVNRRATLPHGTWRKAYGGVAKEASSTQLAIEPVALLEARSEVDEMIVDNSPDPIATRRSEDLAFVEGLGQELVKTLIWGTTEGSSVVNPEEIVGLQQRLAATTLTTVISNGGSDASTQTSIYVVNFGRKKTYGILPPASQGKGLLGLSTEDKGTEPVTDGSGNKYYAYVTQFKWYIGLAVADELSIGRVCNIDTALADTYTFNEDKLIELLNLGHFTGGGTRIFFNKSVATQAQIRLKDKSNVNWDRVSGLSGMPITTFQSIPCIALDNTIILNTEEVVA